MKAPARRVLTVSVRNVGNTRWYGCCETLFSISKEGAVEFIIAFAPGGADMLARRKSEIVRGRVILAHIISLLALDPGQEWKLPERRGPPSDNFMGVKSSTIKPEDLQ